MEYYSRFIMQKTKVTTNRPALVVVLELCSLVSKRPTHTLQSQELKVKL